MKNDDLTQLSINAIRVLAMDSVENAKSGHPGMAMGSAPLIYELFSNHLKHNPLKPYWENRDRFVLSAGHASILLYSVLHLFGYPVSLDDLKKFRRLGSNTPGHPEYGYTDGVEATSGPLGQGVSMAVGMAWAESNMAARFNKSDYPIVDHYTYALVGDGCLQEGVASEASSFAGTAGLGKLIVLYDSNQITIDGGTDLSFSEDVAGRYKSYGWQVIDVEDGTDTDAVGKAIEKAKTDPDHPSLIICKTIIGHGAPNQGKSVMHGSPLGAEDIAKTKEFYKWPCKNAFEIPTEVYTHTEELRKTFSSYEAEWEKLLVDYTVEYPDVAKEYREFTSATYDFASDEEFWQIENKDNASRNISGQFLNKVAQRLSNIAGGSADLTGPNVSAVKGVPFYNKETREGTNIHFGVREFGMGAIVNGMTLSGYRAYGATFLTFSDYMRNSLRLAALMNIPSVFIYTHDSILIGADGPTHQSVEHVNALRLIPNLDVWRPADGMETAAAYASAFTVQNPSTLLFTRQKVPFLNESSREASKGGYVIRKEKGKKLDLVILATGSEVALALAAADKLSDEKYSVRVVSIPCLEVFEKQSQVYREEVLGSVNVKRMSVECGTTALWYKYVGLNGLAYGIDRFGLSADESFVREHFGFTEDAVAKAALEFVKAQ